MQERDRQHEAQGIDADRTDDYLEGSLTASAQGYQEAWSALSAKLEGLGKDVYTFAPQNPYYDTTAATAPETASSSSSSAAAAEDDGGAFNKGMELFQAGRVPEAVLAFEASVRRCVF